MIIVLAITALVACIIAIFNFKKNSNALYLSAFLFILSLYGFTHYVTVEVRSVYWGAISYINLTPLYLLMGPAIYFYVTRSIKPRRKYRKTDLLHLIPFGVDLIGISSYLFSSFSYKEGVIQSLYSNPETFRSLNEHLIFQPNANYVIRMSLLLIYTIYCLITLRKFYVKKFEAEKEILPKQTSMKWLVFFLGLVLLMTLSYVVYIIMLFDTANFYSTANTILLAISTTSISLMSLSLLLFPNILYGISRVSYKTDITNNQFNVTPYYLSLQERIDTYFANKEPYLKKTFSRVDLAKALKVPSHHITFCFKYVYESSFPAYKLEHRIEWVKRSLVDPANKDVNIDDIGYKAGFASKSNFYVNFKDHTGYTPKGYQEEKAPWLA
jgi:AraC-like DNA-binding protein